ncbi:MAG: hypothetical protein WBD31_25200, partial [Rubripirellula sp.]
EFDETAEAIEELWSDRMPQFFDNPIYTSLQDRIRELRDQQTDFRILAINRQRSNYVALLDDLELTGADLFCTVAQIKKLDPFDTLVTCGPFRDDVDSLFSSPRYPNIVNVRWAHDNDVHGFPMYLNTDANLDDCDAQFPSDFPVQINAVEQFDTFECHAEEATKDQSLTTWSFDDFEALFVNRNRERRSNSWTRKPTNTERGLTDHDYASVKLSFVDGSEWQLGFDQAGISPQVLSIDGDGDRELRRRRLSIGLNGEDTLAPGMLVVVEQDATDEFREIAEVHHELSRQHLRGWKRLLRERIQESAANRRTVKFEFQLLGIRSERIEQNVRRWSTESDRPEAPEDWETFETVVGKFAKYSQVAEAWDEVEALRNSAKQDGRESKRNINRHLENAVRANLDAIADEPRSLLSVGGFAKPVVVVEFSHAIFYREGQLSQLGKYRRSDDAEDMDWLNG